jgi:hypothetical protein
MDMWTYREASYGDLALEGYDVEAADGGIGKVDSASGEAGAAYLVVDTGPWIFGRRILLPAGLVESVDADRRRVRVSCTKDQLRQAPEHPREAELDDAYRSRVTGLYARPDPAA